MKYLVAKAIICLVTVGMFGAQELPAQDEAAASTAINGLVTALRQGEVGTIEVFRLPKNLRSFSAVEPEDVESSWYDKLTIRVRSEQPQSIIEALRSVRPKLWDRRGAGYLRWGFVFYSAHGRKRIAALYFDETGRFGSVGGAWVSFGENLLSRLRAALYFSLE